MDSELWNIRIEAVGDVLVIVVGTLLELELELELERYYFAINLAMGIIVR